MGTHVKYAQRLLIRKTDAALSSGLSMRLLESKKGLSSFAFEHSEEYQQTQHKFLAAVESMEPNNIVVRVSPREFSPACTLSSVIQAALGLHPSLWSLNPKLSLSFISCSSDPHCVPGSWGLGAMARCFSGLAASPKGCSFGGVVVEGEGGDPTTGVVSDSSEQW